MLSFFECGLRRDGLKVFESVLDDFAQVCLGLGNPTMECSFRCSSCRFCSCCPGFLVGMLAEAACAMASWTALQGKRTRCSRSRTARAS